MDNFEVACIYIYIWFYSHTERVATKINKVKLGLWQWQSLVSNQAADKFIGNNIEQGHHLIYIKD